MTEMQRDTDVAIPKATQLAWGLDQPGTRGPRRGLTLDQVIEAAIEVCDAEGFAALSMARLAKQLGFTTMSVYRYVDSKDTLVQLVMDYVIGKPPVIDASLSWRAGLRTWAIAEADAISTRPWWLDIPLGAPPSGPNNLDWLEAGLKTMRGLAIPEQLKFKLVMNTTIFVMGRSRIVREMTSSSATEDHNYPAVLAQILDPQRFPALTDALAGGAFDDDGEVDWEKADFVFALDRLLDGFEIYLDSLPGQR